MLKSKALWIAVAVLVVLGVSGWVGVRRARSNEQRHFETPLEASERRGLPTYHRKRGTALAETRE